MAVSPAVYGVFWAFAGFRGSKFWRIRWRRIRNQFRRRLGGGERGWRVADCQVASLFVGRRGGLDFADWMAPAFQRMAIFGGGGGGVMALALTVISTWET